ncbi:MAG: RimK/LysX family protein [Candidatus Woesearchaeota archaeon]
MNEYKDKVILKAVEKITIKNLKEDKKETVLARIDTGASKSSIGLTLAAELHLGPIKSYSKVKNANGITTRPIVEAIIEIGGKKIKEKFTIANRVNMQYKVLVGRNVLKNGFLVDTTEEFYNDGDIEE